jgi:hypothetical protein
MCWMSRGAGVGETAGAACIAVHVGAIAGAACAAGDYRRGCGGVYFKIRTSVAVRRRGRNASFCSGRNDPRFLGGSGVHRSVGDRGKVLFAGKAMGVSRELPVLLAQTMYGDRFRHSKLLRHQSQICPHPLAGPYRRGELCYVLARSRSCLAKLFRRSSI